MHPRRPCPTAGPSRRRAHAYGETVVGYYALAVAQILPEDATARTLKGQPRARPVPAILLARLAVDRRRQGAGLGRSLLQDVLLRCAAAAEAIGARVLLVHAKHDAAKAWYLQYGFEESPTDTLHLMMLNGGSANSMPARPSVTSSRAPSSAPSRA